MCLAALTDYAYGDSCPYMPSSCISALGYLVGCWNMPPPAQSVLAARSLCFLSLMHVSIQTRIGCAESGESFLTMPSFGSRFLPQAWP